MKNTMKTILAAVCFSLVFASCTPKTENSASEGQGTTESDTTQVIESEPDTAQVAPEADTVANP